jgi:hypothetical protein
VFRQLVKDRVAEAMKGRAEIQAAPDDTARAIQEQRHRSLEARLTDIRRRLPDRRARRRRSDD